MLGAALASVPRAGLVALWRFAAASSHRHAAAVGVCWLPLLPAGRRLLGRVRALALIRRLLGSGGPAPCGVDCRVAGA
eukprot:3584326-Alexandrium_andersonii.AAC.1